MQAAGRHCRAPKTRRHPTLAACGGGTHLMTEKQRAPRNRTMILTDEDRRRYGSVLWRLDSPVELGDVLDSTIRQDVFDTLDLLPKHSFDLVFADPPYNLTKHFNGAIFKETDIGEYEEWLTSWLPKMRELLKPDGCIYVCGDWRSSSAIHRVAR